ncbi:DUF768 domain-containing protein [Phyllobacterium myrsinacearum]|uniref:DUF768 domain-containing protein n=1 Tax=Phyllobacterium myrsinacearum TaxID=28101 RepID=A0A839EG88_9HYPH|nr:DUF768 domain-containing protein [Phyllobacterium myrsinacearum]MBA8877398.1 hypothetical protein [Phyllobacterium myrsinacearum]
MNTLGPALAFAKTWVAQNVRPYALDNVEEKGEELASAFLADAKAAGFDEAEIKEAIDDDIADYMIEALYKVRDPEAGRS